MPKIIKKHGKTALVLGLILLLIGLYNLVPVARAGTATSRKDQLSDSRPSTVANHTIYFTTTASGAAVTGETLTITFDSAFDTSAIDEDDVDITSAAEELTTAADCTGSEDLSAVIAADVITFTVCSDGTGKIGATEAVVIEVGLHALASGTGDAQISNPALLGCSGASSICSVTLGGDFGDTGTMKVAIVSGVTVTAVVSETLSFVVGAVANNDDCDSSFTTYAGPGSSATAINFGTLAAVDTFNHACQDLTVSTNADGGYAVTVQELTNLRDSVISQNIADSTGDNATMDESTSDTWATASGNDGFGFSCANLSGTDCAFTYTNYRQLACTGSNANCDPGSGAETPQSVMSNANPVSGSSGRVEYKLTVSGTQMAGTYTNTVMYIATPTY